MPSATDLVTIYGLEDPQDGCFRYVGQTIDPQMRLKLHLSQPINKKMKAWVDQLQSVDLEPTMVLLEQVDEWNAYEAETHWIDVVGRRHKLLNVFRVPVTPRMPQHGPQQIYPHKNQILIELDGYVLGAYRRYCERKGTTEARHIKRFIADTLSRSITGLG